MPALFRTWLMASAMTIAQAVPALAQAVTTFDGTYNGVSESASGGGRGCVPPTPVPRTLTIKNGVVQWAGGMTGDRPFQGSVNAQGGVTARSDTAIVFTGNIENGKLTGNTNGGGSCTIALVWQKQ